MNGAELKATLKAGGRVFGTMLNVTRSPAWVPTFDAVGLDYVVVDTEHAPLGRGEMGALLHSFRASGVVPIVRIPIPTSHYVTMAMDAGAQGVLAPYCETAEQAAEVVAAAKWRPLKGEAVDRVMASGEHVSDATRAYLEENNKNSVAIIGVESRAAVDNLENILSVPGIDGIFVGPNDMSISLGVPDQYDTEVYQQHGQVHHRYCRGPWRRHAGAPPDPRAEHLLHEPRRTLHPARLRASRHDSRLPNRVRDTAGVR